MYATHADQWSLHHSCVCVLCCSSEASTFVVKISSSTSVVRACADAVTRWFFSCNFSLIARSRVPTSVAGSRRVAHSSLCSLQVVVVLAAFFGLEPSSCNLFAFSSLRLAFAAVVDVSPIAPDQNLAPEPRTAVLLLGFRKCTPAFLCLLLSNRVHLKFDLTCRSFVRALHFQLTEVLALLILYFLLLVCLKPSNSCKQLSWLHRVLSRINRLCQQHAKLIF